jgi:3-hydroxybutyryl-CoA dehydrogenase
MNIVIVGGGTMGTGVAKMLKRNNLDPRRISMRPEMPISHEMLELLGSADVILECVTESESEKNFVHLICSENNIDGLIASCTSSLTVTQLQKTVVNPSRFLGIHFMNPPSAIPFVEIALGELTSQESLDRATIWLESIDRVVTLVPDSPGFALNAILFAMLNRAAYFVQNSAMNPQAVDELLIGVCGHKLGPLATLDLIGLDVSLTILENLHAQEPEMNLPPAPVLRKFVEEGNLGKKTKKGFHAYG